MPEEERAKEEASKTPWIRRAIVGVDELIFGLLRLFLPLALLVALLADTLADFKIGNAQHTSNNELWGLLVLWALVKIVEAWRDATESNLLTLRFLAGIRDDLDRTGNILGGILASMPEPSRAVEPRSDWERFWASIKKPRREG